jgi:xanthine dehydrogenase large subunit
MKQDDINLHVQGKSKFVDDVAVPTGTLYAAVFTSSVAHADIVRVDYTKARSYPGVVDILTYEDIPGLNEIGNIIKDEPLLAEKQVHYQGQPIAVVVAETPENARKARTLIEITFSEKEVVTDPRIAFQNNSLIAPPRTFNLGNINEAWSSCDVIIEGRVDSGGQEHLYLETMSAITIPVEENKLKIISSTQSPTAVQKTTAWILDLPMHKIEVEVMRLGGGFGGKEDQATPWAAMSALAAYKLNRPVKLVLKRGEDIRVTGKRHPYSSDYKMGLTNDGKIIAYEVTFYQNAGASADLSTAILERTLFHTTNSYFIPNVKATANSCRTNLPPNTAFRGFGGPQAMFVIESALHKASGIMNISKEELQQKNLIKKDDVFPYGMKVLDNHALTCWNRCNEIYDFKKMKKNAATFNSENTYLKKGFSLMPVCFGISFTSTFMNQASALVHIYNDGSIYVSTGAVEMGQGVNDKIKHVVAKVFSVPMSRIKVDFTNTTRNANTSPTAASSGADMNGNATKIACENILTRLIAKASELLDADKGDIAIKDKVVLVKNEPTELMWEELVSSTYMSRISLSCQAFYSTPKIFFDRATEKGDAFAYHVVGTAITEVTVDCLRGTYKIDKVKIVHDYGNSLDHKIDRGQTEGALAQGIGWMTMEEIKYDDSGRLLSNSLSTYKVPDIFSSAQEIEIEFYENPENSAGPFNSKAIGEPPFMYGIGTYFAILNAMTKFKSDIKIKYDAPLTPEKLLLMLYAGDK